MPWDPDEAEKKLLLNKFMKFYNLQEKFNVTNGNELYSLYRNLDYMKKLSFEERKQFMILFSHYVINVPVKKALQIVGEECYLNNRIPNLYDSDFYDSKTGLKVSFAELDGFI